MKCVWCRTRPAQGRCGGCKDAVYCNESCQSKHWDQGHRLRCIQPVDLKLYETNADGKRQEIDYGDDIIGFQTQDDDTIYKLTVDETIRLGLVFLVDDEIFQNREEKIILPEFADKTTISTMIGHMRGQVKFADIQNLDLNQLHRLLATINYTNYFDLFPWVLASFADALQDTDVESAVRVLLTRVTKDVIGDVFFFFRTTDSIFAFQNRIAQVNEDAAYRINAAEYRYYPSPFAVAAKDGRADIVDWLLQLPAERGVDPAIKDNYPLYVATEFGHTEVARLLLELPPERGVDPATRRGNPLRVAARNGYTEVVRMLLQLPVERGVDPAIENNYPLYMAAQNGYTEIVRLLLELPPERGVDPAINDNNPLVEAAYFGRTEVVRLLLQLPPQRGVDPAAQNNAPLRYAAVNGHAEVVRLLLDLPPERGVDVLVGSNAPLMAATRNGHVEVVRLLRDHLSKIFQ